MGEGQCSPRAQVKNTMENKKQLVVAVTLVKNNDGKFLLRRRCDTLFSVADGKWELPGGKVDFGELPEDTAVRETKEEAGCDVAIERMLPQVQSRVWKQNDEIEVHVVVLCFVARYVRGIPTILDDKASEIAWFTKEEIATLDTLSGVAEFIALL